MRSNGVVTYIGKDIANQFWKFGLLGRDFRYRRFATQADGRSLWASTSADTEPGAPAFGKASRIYNVIDSRQMYLQALLAQVTRLTRPGNFLGVPTLSFTQTHAFTTPGRSLAFMVLSFLFLYLNFSGFTDIAVGSGMLFNLNLSENFRFPLIAHSIQNFWQRWHLSLSKFITAYMFKPMLRRTGRTALSLIVTFTLIGLWHRTTVGYLLWGVALAVFFIGFGVGFRRNSLRFFARLNLRHRLSCSNVFTSSS